MSMVLYHKYLFGGHYFLFTDIGSDTINTYFPRLYHYVSHFWDFQSYNFHDGLGRNNVNAQITNTLNPFNASHLLVGKDNLAGFLIYLNIFKILGSGIFFYLFIQRLVKNEFSAFVSGLLYAFSGFMMLWGQHYMFATFMVFFAMLLLSIEIYLEKGKWIFLMLSLMLCSLSLYVFYQILILITVYLFFRHLYFGKSLYTTILTILKIYGFVLFSLLVLAFLHLPAIYYLLDSPRINFSTSRLTSTSSIISFKSIEFYIITLGRFFGNDITGGPLNFFGWIKKFPNYAGNYYEAPQIYSGIVTLLLIPQIFSIQDTRKKRLCLGLLLFSVVLLVFPIFGTIFNGFQYPMYRWTYGILTFNLIITSLILSNSFKDNSFSLKIHWLSFIVLVTFLVILASSIWFLYDIEQFYYSAFHIAIILGFLIAWFALFLIKNTIFSGFKMLMSVLLIIELVTVHYASVNNRKSVLNGQIGYFDKSVEKIETIKSEDSTLFYRIDKQYFSQKTNDALVQEYFGIRSYSSLHPRSYVEFCKLFGIDDGIQIRHLPSRNPKFNRYKLLDLLGVKYLLSEERINHSQYKLLDTTNAVFVYQSTTSKPLGFVCRKYKTYDEIATLPATEIDSLALFNVYIDPKEEEIIRKYTKTEDLNFDASEQGNNLSPTSALQDSLILTHFEPSRIKGTVNMNNSGILFLSILYDKGWRLILNGDKVSFYKVHGGFIGIPLAAGVNQIELFFRPPLFDLGIIISLISMIIVLIYAVARLSGKTKLK